jgi:restriction endonuclease S subunit
LNAEYARRHWNAVCNTSSGLNTINRRQLRRLLVPLPKRDEQAGILDLITAAENSIQAIERKQSALDRLRRSLRQNLLTGHLRLRVGEHIEPEADRILAEAVG